MHSRRVFARRGGRGTVDPSLFQKAVRDFAALFVAGNSFWFDADLATATSATDHLDATHTLSLSAGSLSAPAADPLFPTLCKTLRTTGTQWLDGSRAGSAYSVYLNGAGCTRLDVFAPTSLAATQVLSCVGNVASASAVQGYLATSGAPLLQVTNDAGAGIISNVAGTGLVVNTPTFIGYTQLSTAWVKYRLSAVVASGTSGATGTAAALPLRIAAQSGGTNATSMAWRGSYGWTRVLTAAEWRSVYLYLRLTAGVQS